MGNTYFERFARAVCEYAVKNFFIPYLREHGVIQSYRAEVVSKDTGTKTMVVQRPFDRPVTLPYSNSASDLTTGDQCIVLSLGDSTNSVVFADGKMDVSSSGGGAPKNMWYGTSGTSVSTAAKVATTTTGDFVLETGNMVRVKFTNANSYNGTATLNVDGTGAKSIARVGTTLTTRYYWTAGEVVDFVYDGTNYVMSNKGTATTTYYGLVKLTTTATSASTSLVPTASCVDAKIAAKVPEPPATAGTYSLKCTVDSGGNATYSWS